MEQRRRRRTAPRLAGLLACAAVPAMLIAGCSSGSGSGSGSGSTSGSSSGSDSGVSTSNGAASSTSAPSAGTGGATGATPTPLAPAKYATLPASCKTVTPATVSALVPKAKAPGGTEAKSSDIQSRGGCAWTGNGKDGYQYRWLSVTLQRFTSSPGVGSAEERAKKRFADQVRALGEVSGTTTSTLTGLGDQASSVSGRVTVAKVTSQNGSVVVRAGNVVLIVEFDGAGLAGKKNPAAETVRSGARRAAKDAVAAVAAANT